MRGKALVHVPDAALNGYVEAIRLRRGSVQPDPIKHRFIANCLKASCAEALALLAACDDGTCTVNKKLDLDYAVVGYWNA
ncbi:hypothetical protein [Bradyrhizobium sp. SEMIA]|uniref:hypothetical protein n=1 Tax=Bradyrhizobium sp. SEMIA TaxID=2597515 RepID=UPI0018A3D267|nr:hypothetical protein [Bradyrhizobium sp. SEMIA]QOG21038.1 hypothetical protein FOM02_30615 [Bradyrhizobium sp. SEMIA]